MSEPDLKATSAGPVERESGDTNDDGLDIDVELSSGDDLADDDLADDDLADDDLADDDELVGADDLADDDEDHEDDEALVEKGALFDDATEDEEDPEDDSEEDADDLDDELDEILEEDEEVQALDEEESGKKGAKPRRKPELISDDEFTCRSCFLVKKPSQLADSEAMLCFDCV